MKSPWFISIWKDKAYFDLWHFNHFLAGILCAGLAIFFSISFWHALIISTSLMLGWEFYEIANKIKETLFNKFMDVLLSIVAFLLYFFSYQEINSEEFATVFYISLFLWIMLETWGYLAYKSK